MSIKAKHNALINELLQDSRYQVNSNGTILRVKDGKSLGYVKASEENKRGKPYVYIKYKGKEIKLHRIIYAKFGGELIPGHVIHHKDDNSLNPAFDNLEQVTQSANNYYRYK